MYSEETVKRIRYGRTFCRTSLFLMRIGISGLGDLSLGDHYQKDNAEWPWAVKEGEQQEVCYIPLEVQGMGALQQSCLRRMGSGAGGQCRRRRVGMRENSCEFSRN